MGGYLRRRPKGGGGHVKIMEKRKKKENCKGTIIGRKGMACYLYMRGGGGDSEGGFAYGKSGEGGAIRGTI